MIIDNFNIVRIIVMPLETYAPFIVDLDAVPALPIDPKGIQSVASLYF
jgi:hypothetical protein